MFAYALFGAAACAPRIEPAGPPVTEPRLTAEAAVATDGARLPIRRWLPDGKPAAVIVGVHGFNDYSKSFDLPGQYWAERGVATYAYDQRGFGQAPNRGVWPGTETLTTDLRDVVALVRKAHPGTPVYVAGESMGGAVVTAAMTSAAPPDADGAIVLAPAVRGRNHLGTGARYMLWFFANTIPWYTLTGQGMRVQASDNVEALKALGRDPNVIKQTRIDTIHGLVDLMDLADERAEQLSGRVLVLYGMKDEIVTNAPTLSWLRRLPAAEDIRVAIYETGYHLLLRDLKRDTVADDIVSWVRTPKAKLPSGAEAAARRILAGDVAKAAD